MVALPGTRLGSGVPSSGTTRSLPDHLTMIGPCTGCVAAAAVDELSDGASDDGRRDRLAGRDVGATAPAALCVVGCEVPIAAEASPSCPLVCSKSMFM